MSRAPRSGERVGQIDLAIPAFYVIEPYWMFEGRRRGREDLYRKVQEEVDQIGRSSALREETESLRRSLQLLARVSREHDERLAAVRGDVEGTARVLPTDATVLARGWRLQAQFAMSAFDAVVAASILIDLRSNADDRSLFVTTNSRDFQDPDLVSEFSEEGCQLVYTFDAAVARIAAWGAL